MRVEPRECSLCDRPRRFAPCLGGTSLQDWLTLLRSNPVPTSLTATRQRRSPVSQARSPRALGVNSTAVEGLGARPTGHDQAKRERPPALPPQRTGPVIPGATKSGILHLRPARQLWLQILIRSACWRRSNPHRVAPIWRRRCVPSGYAPAVRPDTTAGMSVASVGSRSASQPDCSCGRPRGVPRVLQMRAPLRLPLRLRSNGRKSVRPAGSTANALQPSGSDISVVTAARGVEGAEHESKT